MTPLVVLPCRARHLHKTPKFLSFVQATPVKDGPLHVYRAIIVPSCCNSEYFFVGLGITRAVELGASFEGFNRRHISARNLTNTSYAGVLRQKNITEGRGLRQRSGLRRRNTKLPHVFSTTLLIGNFTLFVGLIEQHLRHSLIRVNLCR